VRVKSIARYDKAARIEDKAGTCYEAKDAKESGTRRLKTNETGKIEQH
jgi:hypothetical protein